MSAYLIYESEIEKLKTEYAGFPSSGAYFYLKAWVCGINQDGRTLDVIVSEDQPPAAAFEIKQVVEPRPSQQEAVQPSSETLWGDLKRASKRAVNEIEKRVEQDREQRANFQAFPNRISIKLHEQIQTDGIKPGDAFYFRLTRPQSLRLVLQRSHAFTVESDAVFSTLPTSTEGGLSEFLTKRSNRRQIKIAIIVGGIVAFFAAVLSRNTPQSNEPIPYIKESCPDVSRAFSPGSPHTTVQQEEIWQSLHRRAFRWKLTVQDVTESEDGYTVSFKCSPSNSLIEDVEVEYPALIGKQATALQKGGTYLIRGVLSDYVKLTGVLKAQALQDEGRKSQ